MNHAGEFSPAWVYFHGSKAGLSYRETANLPIGRVNDIISCWLIEEKNQREKSSYKDVFDF